MTGFKKSLRACVSRAIRNQYKKHNNQMMMMTKASRAVTKPNKMLNVRENT